MNKDLEEVLSVLSGRLVRAGLPTNVKEVVGRQYLLLAEKGSHFEVMSGKVVAVTYSDESDLALYVSNPTYRGDELVTVSHNGKEWVVRYRFKSSLGDIVPTVTSCHFVLLE